MAVHRDGLKHTYLSTTYEVQFHQKLTEKLVVKLST